MWRAVTAVIGGLFAWGAIVTLINFGLRWWLPGYQAAEPTLVFTFTMMVARLSMAAVTSLTAGAVVSAISERWWPPLLVGLITLGLFVPSHVYLWDKFPVWYHLSFLVPLVPLVMLGATLGPKRHASAA